MLPVIGRIRFASIGWELIIGKLARSIPITISAKNRSYKQASAITYSVDEANFEHAS